MRGHESDALVCAVFESARFHAEASVLADFAFGLRVAADVGRRSRCTKSSTGAVSARGNERDGEEGKKEQFHMLKKQHIENKGARIKC